MNPRIARLVANFQGHNAINVRTVDIYIQMYPGKPDVDHGIEGLDYKVFVNNSETQSGRTASNGKITVRIPPGTTPVLQVMGTDYEITSSNAAFANVNTTTGKKERLRFLGYQIGHGGTLHNGVDNVDNTNATFEYARSILDFQADQGLDLNGDRASIEASLTTEAGS